MLQTELLDLIGSIYDAALDASLWQACLETVRQRLNFHNGMMTLIDVRQSQALFAASANVPHPFSEMATPLYASEIVRMWGGPEAIGRHMLEEPTVLSEVVDPDSWQDNRYYKDFAAPQGLVDVVAIAVLREPHMVGSIAFGRHESFGMIAQPEVEKLRILAPHFRRAALISGVLATSATLLGDFEASMEATSAGIVLVDGNMAIRHANQAAERMLQARDPIRNADGRLKLRLELMPGQLALAVEAAASDPAGIGRRGIGIPTRRRDGSPLVVHIVPLNVPSRRTFGPRGAVAAVFIADSQGPPRGGADALGLLFDLTPSEARVFELTVAGRTNSEIMAITGIAASTLKSHVLSIFRKTGRHSRADLIMLARELNIDG